jgi:hypothetical protein
LQEIFDLHDATVKGNGWEKCVTGDQESGNWWTTRGPGVAPGVCEQMEVAGARLNALLMEEPSRSEPTALCPPPVLALADPEEPIQRVEEPDDAFVPPRIALAIWNVGDEASDERKKRKLLAKALKGDPGIRTKKNGRQTWVHFQDWQRFCRFWESFRRESQKDPYERMDDYVREVERRKQLEHERKAVGRGESERRNP